MRLCPLAVLPGRAAAPRAVLSLRRSPGWLVSRHSVRTTTQTTHSDMFAGTEAVRAHRQECEKNGVYTWYMARLFSYMA